MNGMSGGSRRRRIVITGAYGILGAATARAATLAGARVALIDRAVSPPDGLREACGPDAVFVGGADLSTSSAAVAALAAAAQGLGGIDALINVAGAFRWQTVEDGDPAVWDLLYTINLKSALYSSRAALSHLRQSDAGRIVNVGANAALKAAAGMAPYAASKAAVHRLTESLAEELKPAGITVNAVLPSIIDTPSNRVDMPNADYSTWVKPAALAAVILFLASEAAQPITGALLPVVGQV